MTFKGVIFDVDGTLVDSNGAHALAWQQALEEHGQQVEYATLRRLIGMGGDKLLPEVTNGIQIDSPEGEAIAKRRQAIFKEEYLPQIKAFDRVQLLIKELINKGYSLAIATSAKDAELDPLLDIAGVNDLISLRTSSDDAEQSKPDPDIVLAALEKLDLSQAEVVMVGDTPYDLVACQRAGIAFIGLESGGWHAEDLEGAIAVYTDARDLLRHLELSPLAS